MALVCTSYHAAGPVRSRIDDNKLSSVTRVVCCVNLVWPKTTRVWDNSGDACALRRNREGRQRQGQWRAVLSNNSGYNPTGISGERPTNGGIRTVVVTHLQKVDSNVEEGSEGKFPANPDAIKSKDISTKGSSYTGRGDTVIHSAESGETIPYDLSKLSAVPQSSRSGHLQEDFREQDEGTSEAEAEKYVSLVWEAGSEIEKVTPEMASSQNRSGTDDEGFSSTVEEERHRQEPARNARWPIEAVGKEPLYLVLNLVTKVRKSVKEVVTNGILSEPLLGVEISRQVSNLEAQWLNRQSATKRPIWITREDNAFSEFFGNLSKIQQKIWLMMVVYGKLAWIRLQQLLARRLKQLEGILANLPESENDLNEREAELLAFSGKLMNQSAVQEGAYKRSQEALRVADGIVFRLDTQIRQLTQDVASRDSLLRLLQVEASVSSESLQRAAQSLCDAERRIIHLEKQVKAGEETLWAERDKLTTAVKTAVSFEEAAKVSENKVVELTAEISSLRTLAAAGSRAEYLSAQVKALEEELKSRDYLLLEVKAETKRNTEALTVAAQIKQDLNTARQREVQLTQTLESANDMVKELQTQLSENLRSLRAEQALKQMEKMLGDAKLEVQRLRKGVEERDKSIFLMKDEVDLNIGLLNNAARDREELHKMKLQVEDLKAELGSKDNKLIIMREEMASVINLARQKQSTFSGTSTPDHTSTSGAGPSPAVRVSKPKTKLRSKKQTGSQRSLPSPQSS